MTVERVGVISRRCFFARYPSLLSVQVPSRVDPLPFWTRFRCLPSTKPISSRCSQGKGQPSVPRTSKSTNSSPKSSEKKDSTGLLTICTAAHMNQETTRLQQTETFWALDGKYMLSSLSSTRWSFIKYWRPFYVLDMAIVEPVQFRSAIANDLDKKVQHDCAAFHGII